MPGMTTTGTASRAAGEYGRRVSGGVRPTGRPGFTAESGWSRPSLAAPPVTLRTIMSDQRASVARESGRNALRPLRTPTASDTATQAQATPGGQRSANGPRALARWHAQHRRQGRLCLPGAHAGGWILPGRLPRRSEIAPHRAPEAIRLYTLARRFRLSLLCGPVRRSARVCRGRRFAGGCACGTTGRDGWAGPGGGLMSEPELTCPQGRVRPGVRRAMCARR